WQLDEPTPYPSSMINELILWVGENQKRPNDYAVAQISALSALLDCEIVDYGAEDPVGWIVNQAEHLGLIQSFQISGWRLQIQLPLAGWTQFEGLKNAQISSRTAFMAMQFGDIELDGAFANCFEPAVQRAGFRLRKVTDEQPAGL